MELIRFDPGAALPLENGTNATYVPVMSGDRLVAMLLRLDRRGDTGKREVGSDVMMVVISGEGKVRSGGTIADVQAGDVLILPGGLLHHIWTADSRLEAVLLSM